MQTATQHQKNVVNDYMELINRLEKAKFGNNKEVIERLELQIKVMAKTIKELEINNYV